MADLSLVRLRHVVGLVLIDVIHVRRFFIYVPIVARIRELVIGSRDLR